MSRIAVSILLMTAGCLATKSSSVSQCQSGSDGCGSTTNKYSKEANIYITTEEMYKRGHLKPFGSHKSPDFQATELPYMISPEDFYMNFIIHHQPVKFEGAAKSWPAFQIWTDTYLDDKYGNETVKMDAKMQIKSEKLGEFLKKYKDERSNSQLIGEIMPGMKREVALPTCLRCKEMYEQITANFLLSNGNEMSPIHIDNDDKLICALAGQRKILMVSPVYSKYLYADEALVQGISDIDASAVDLERYPDVMNILYWQVKIAEGDCVYVPQLWWHQISSSDGRQLAVELLWKSKSLWRNVDSAEKATSSKLTPEQKKEKKPYSLSSALKEYEEWMQEIAPKMPMVECKEQKKLMSQYQWETDKEENAPMTLGDQGVIEEEVSEELDDMNSIREKVEEKIKEGEVACFFDTKNKDSPCHRNCDESEDLGCVAYILDYCGRYDDRGCVINKPHILNKKQKEEMEEMAKGANH